MGRRVATRCTHDRHPPTTKTRSAPRRRRRRRLGCPLANRASVSIVIIGRGWVPSRRDTTTNGRHRLGTAVIVVRLMGCAFLRLLSQPADYDMLVASASERASNTRHTTCTRHRNAICPANDSLALSVTEGSVGERGRGRL